MVPVDVAQLKYEAIDRRSEVTQSPIETVASPQRVNTNALDFFLLRFIAASVGGRYAIDSVVDLYVGAEKHFFAVPAEAHAAIDSFRAGIKNLACDGRAVVARANAAALTPDHPLALAILESGTASGKAAIRPAARGHKATKTLVRMAVMFVMTADGIDRAAHRVAAIEQSGRPLDDFEPLELSGVHHLAVIA